MEEKDDENLITRYHTTSQPGQFSIKYQYVYLCVLSV
jgi:hypothetical protein